MQDIQQEFEHMVQRIQNTPKNRHSDNASLRETLRLYALFKQSTLGDVQGQPPSILRMVERAKYYAHKDLQGMPRHHAMRAYLDLVYRIEARDTVLVVKQIRLV